MCTKKKALLIGDYSKPKYHSLKNIDRELCDIFCNEMEILCTEDYGMLVGDQLKKFDLFISYLDCWDQKLAPQQVAGLLAFVSRGGGLLVIHNGISIQSSHELAQLMGARFTGHPAYGKLDFLISAPTHPIMEGIGEFQMDEEPYQFDFSPFTERIILMEYRHENLLYPAAWTDHYGLGRVVYLMPGHHVESFQNPVYRKIILTSAKWACMSV